jgi:hypothetical protein
MRFNLRIKKFGYTLFMMLSKTQTLEGIPSKVIGKEGYHYPFFDIEKHSKIVSLEEVKIGLGKIQTSNNLSDFYITSDKEGSYRAYCFSEIKYTDYLRMQLDLLDAELLDYNFFWWTTNRSEGTLRVSNKKDRPKQKVVSVLESYFVPIPKRMKKVIYDTGIEKRGLTVFLGEKGKIIKGDNNA